MDDQQIVYGLRGLALAEPPLGFDPDVVADTAAKRVRGRRTALAAGAVTVVVIGAVVAFVAPAKAPGQVATPPSTSKPAPSRSDANRQHLRDVLPALLPGATDIEVGPFEEKGRPAELATAVVTFHDSSGPATFNVTIASPAGRDHLKSADDLCDSKHPDRGPGGMPLRCEKRAQPDGSSVLLMERAIEGNQAMVTGLDATHYLPGGGQVGILNEKSLPGDLAQRYNFRKPDGDIRLYRGEQPLTERQLLELVTDPALTLG
jgi:hypothetical protein